MLIQILTIISLLYIGLGTAILIRYIYSKINPKSICLPIIVIILSSITILLLLRGVAQ